MGAQPSPTHAFDDLWERFAPQIASGEAAVDTTSDLPIFTLVARVGTERARELLASITDVLGTLADHYVYPASDIHLTLLYLSPYLYSSDDAGSRRHWLTARKAIASVIERTEVPRFTISGLGIFPTTVFAQLYPDGPTDFAALRRTIAGELHGHGLVGPNVAAFEQRNAWELCFANVVRFTGPVAPETASVVGCKRRLDLGTVEFTEVELVQTDKFLSAAGTEIIDTFRFARPRVNHAR